jgi:alpha/beta superfamily hydrolase
MHGNCSSRCGALSVLKYLLPMNITLFAFDFSGCGKSEGDYISLGYYEKEDIRIVVEYLRSS